MSQPTGNRRLRVAVCFGGPSVEHDVSIITAQQLMSVLGERHEPLPVYLGRDGRWWTGGALRDVSAFGPDEPAGGEPCELRLGTAASAFVSPGGGRLKRDRDLVADVVICAVHGTGGEDGTLLGALEHTGIPYVGGGVAAAAVAMDKALAKLVIGSAGIDVNPHALLTREEFSADPSAAAARAAETAGLPCYAKPISLGSSIGVSHCATAAELEEALELCFELDRRALVEPALDSAIEVNAAVLGRPGAEPRVSTLEQPVKGQGAALSFEDKYLRGGKGGEKGGGATAGEVAEGGGAKTGEGGEPGGMATQDRIIPAPIPEALADRIRDAARRAHEALGFAGVVRYDFLVEDPDGPSPRIVLNEPNTVPGSFAFYLFEPSGLPFVELADALIEIAFAEAAERRATTRTFESILLSQHRGAGS